MFYQIIVFVVWFSVTNCQNDFFVVKTYSTNSNHETNYCVTNSSFAISWINENVESFQQFVSASKFIPKLSERNRFENMKIPENWAIEKSINGFIKDLIIDWRWENFIEHRTTFVEDSLNPLQFIPALSNLGNNFTIPFSILTEEAHIFLCDGSDVLKSNCYWILMQTYGGTKTAFRKCAANKIPKKNKLPEAPCNNFLRTINHPKDFPIYLSRGRWSHFKIEKRNNHIILFQASKSNLTEIISYVDNETVIDVKHMIIHSKRSNGRWKIHQSKYFFTTKQTIRVRFGPAINAIDNSVCISMFASMCSSCSIKLSLATEDTPSVILQEKSFTAETGWVEKKIFKDNIYDQKVILLVSTINRGNHDSFWAIDGIRHCQKKESRYMEINTPAKCQLISSTENIISTNELTDEYNDGYNCPEDTVSSHCVPCKWFIGDCGRTKVYEKYKTTTKYSCSTGHSGIKCDIACLDGTYGQGCRRKCGQCEDICDKFDGTCKHCKDDYSGLKCEIPPKKVRNLQITVLNSSSVYVEWNKPLFGIYHNISVSSYMVKYQHKSYMACKPNPSDTKWEINKTVSDEYITLADLVPYSSYTISVFAKYLNDKGTPERREFQTNSSETMQGQEIPEIQNINPKGRYVEITFSMLYCVQIRGPLLIMMKANCSNKWCRNSHISKSDFDCNNEVSKTLTNLTPFSNYVLEIKYCRNYFICSDIVKTQNFVTESTAPGVVINPEIYTKNEHSASLRWTPPYPPNGILEIYSIDYYCDNTKVSKNFSITQCPLWPDFHCVTLSNLEKLKPYSITIMAKNKDVFDLGQKLKIFVYTKTEPSDAPYDIKIHWTLENHLEIEWKHPNHTNGDIEKFNIFAFPSISPVAKYNINAKLLVKEYRFIYHFKINATYFLPSTIYRILINAFNGYEGKHSVLEDKSPPSIPSLDIPPKIIALTNTTITLEILTKQIRNQNNSNECKMFILGYDNNTNIQLHPELKKFENDFQISLPKFKMLYECQVHKFNNSHFTIGSNEDIKECVRKSNYSLNPKIKFNITVLLINNDGNKSRYRIYYIYDSDARYKIYNTVYFDDDATTFSEPKGIGLFVLLALLLIILFIIIIYMKRKPIAERYYQNRNIFHRDNMTETIEETPLTSVPSVHDKTKIHSKPIKVNEFEKYLKKTGSSGELERQHALLPLGQTKPWNCGAKTANKSKNRFVNIIAYDHTRVVLQKIDGKEDSDYINANYIDGYKVPRAYIATQAPKISTVYDFWRMIWQENVQHIVMIANVFENGRKEVEPYWPGTYGSFAYDDIAIQLVSIQVYSDYEYREFTITQSNEVRIVHHYHFLSWQDDEFPLYSYSIVPFIRRLLEIPLSSNSPIVVHCSAGIGRTGTVLLCDISLRMALAEGVIDLLRNLQQLRDQRPNMVNNVHQYRLAHLVILEYFVGMKTEISFKDIENEVMILLHNNQVSMQMRYLEEISWQDQTIKDFIATKKELHIIKEKNRFHDIIPEGQSCIYLPKFPSHDHSSSYINAVRIDGFQKPERFIVTQQPMPNTLGDFWRLVAEKNSSAIISLNEIDLKNQTSCEFWPTEKNREMKPVNYITLRHGSTQNFGIYDLVKVHMYLDGQQTYKIIEINSMKNWPATKSFPEEIEDFLTFCSDTNTSSKTSNPVIVTCLDGAKASGLYVAMTFIIEKIKLDQVCDVCKIVRHIRFNRSQFVRTEEQFAFLYKAAVSYVKGFTTYANFQ